MIPAWAASFPWSTIRAAAGANGLDPFLVGAFISVESSGVPWATRYERGYRWLYAPEVYAKELGLTVETETIAQAHSYGLMQIMGATARSLGFKGYLSQLVVPEVGLEWSCLYLAKLVAKYDKIDDAIAAYNAGSPRDRDGDGLLDNHDYVTKVLAKHDDLTKGDRSLPS